MPKLCICHFLTRLFSKLWLIGNLKEKLVRVCMLEVPHLLKTYFLCVCVCVGGRLSGVLGVYSK